MSRYSYVYDDEDHPITRADAAGDYETTYHWDHRGRLVTVVEQRIASGDGEEGELDNVTVEFEYDPLDRRIRKSVGLSEWGYVSLCSQPNVMCTGPRRTGWLDPAP